MKIYLAFNGKKEEVIAATNLSALGRSIGRSGDSLRKQKERNGIPFKIGLYTIHESELIKGNQRGNNLTR
mgnify:CR=1 FL=1|tara:strand:+ start:75 stop:284 length:210 start_codon:yes stop_codon:yes gene_type:complete